jgi:amino acid transporter
MTNAVNEIAAATADMVNIVFIIVFCFAFFGDRIYFKKKNITNRFWLSGE